MLSFHDWLIQKYRNKDGSWRGNRFGDLAGDVAADKSFPRHETDRDAIINHLYSRRACDAAIACCKDAFRRYEREVKPNA